MNNLEINEGKPIIKNQYAGRSLGIFTSGGDAQGMNAILRAAVRMGIYLGSKRAMKRFVKTSFFDNFILLTVFIII